MKDIATIHRRLKRLQAQGNYIAEQYDHVKTVLTTMGAISPNGKMTPGAASAPVDRLRTLEAEVAQLRKTVNDVATIVALDGERDNTMAKRVNELVDFQGKMADALNRHADDCPDFRKIVNRVFHNQSESEFGG